MNKKKVSMKDVADKLGISKVSVSKALNNQPGISQELKKKIFDVANELGYVYTTKPSTAQINKLACVVPKRFFLENENFYTTIYYYLNKQCLSESLDLSLFVVNHTEEKSVLIPPLLNKENFSGIFICGQIDTTYLNALYSLGIPIVSIDFYKSSMNMDSILTDNFYAGYLATEHLIQNGHKEIGFVGNIEQTSSIMDRYFGYQKALHSYNLGYRPEWNIINNDPLTGYYYIDFDLPDKMPSAFVCHCDMAAYFLIQKLQGLKISVPDEVSIVSFDNTDLSRTCVPPLTTIDIDKKEFAVKAYEQMKKRLSKPDMASQRIYVECRLIPRNSVKLLK